MATVSVHNKDERTQSETKRNEDEAKTKTKSDTKTTRRRHEAMTVTIAITDWFCFWALGWKKGETQFGEKVIGKKPEWQRKLLYSGFSLYK